MKPQTGSCAGVDSYVVRIYRHDGGGRRVVGTVQAADDCDAHSFRNAGELWQALCAGHTGPDGTLSNDDKGPSNTGGQHGSMPKGGRK